MLLPVEAPAGRLRVAWPLERIGVDAGGPALAGRGARVALLDSGIDPGHPDLAARKETLAGMRCFVPGETVEDRTGHGTHCAGIVAGPAFPEGGTRYGVAPGARLLIGKIFGRRGRGAPRRRVLEAVRWAREEGARIVVLGAGMSRASGTEWDLTFEELASRLLRERPGVLLIAPAGNNSRRPAVVLPLESPAACPSVLAVAATDASDAAAPFSHGATDGVGTLDLAAPGVGILSSWIGGGLNMTSGTSHAVPYVAGVAALWLEREPELTAAALRDRLLRTARAVGQPADTGAGLVQAPRVAGAG